MLLTGIKKGLSSNLTPLYTAFLHKIKLSEYDTRIQINKPVLFVEQNHYATKIENAY